MYKKRNSYFLPLWTFFKRTILYLYKYINGSVFCVQKKIMWPWPQCHSRGLEFFSIISWTIFWQDLTRNLMGQFQICQLLLNVLFLLQIYVGVVIRETSFCLFLTIIKLMLLQHWTLSQHNFYFKQMVSQIYPIELQLNKANTFDTEALFWNYDLSITNGIVFELVNFSFLDECF